MVGLNTESARVAHLLRRAGFGSTPAELKRYQSLGYERALEELLDYEQVDNSKLERQIKEQDFDFTNAEDLRRWWIYRMAFTERPLQEKMTLFWHGHFATGLKKVGNPYAMYMQNLLLRKYAVGNFHELLLEVSKDPAMIRWLDNQQNRRGKPNENYAREVMELFTMGIGNYTERDIKEAARAFTGWHARPNGFVLNSRQHDFGHKTVLSHSGNLNGDDVVALLAAQPATARRLARKLIEFFALSEPPPSMVDTVAGAYLSSRYQVKPMLRAIFTHPEFLKEKTYHAKLKSPAELVIGTIKALELRKLDGDLPYVLARMGQNLFEPPNVKGWDGGAAWISTDTMMERLNFAAAATGRKFDELNTYTSPSQLVYDQKLKTTGQMVDYLLKLLVDGDIPERARARLISYASQNAAGQNLKAVPDDTVLDTKLRGVVRLILTLPTYQLT